MILFSFLEIMIETQEGLIIIFYKGQRYEFSIDLVPWKFLQCKVEMWEVEEYEGSVNIKFWVGDKE